MSNNDGSTPESALQLTIIFAVTNYVRSQGRKFGKLEAPHPSHQGGNAFRNKSCPFDLLIEIDTRLLMLELKVQDAERKFQHMDDEQLKNLQWLWSNNVEVHYAFNFDVPCPDFHRNPKYQLPEPTLEAIAAVTPGMAKRYLAGVGALDRGCHLKRLVDESETTLPAVLNAWPMNHSELHSTAFLLIAYNLDKGLVAEIPPEQFEDLISVFRTGRLPRPGAQLSLPPEIVTRVGELRRQWKDAARSPDRGPSF